LHIRDAVETDLNDVLLIERIAFGYDKEAELVRDLLANLEVANLASLVGPN